MTRPHTTHHESCGCCEAERDALKAQVERLREEVFRAISIIQVGAHPDSERPAVFKVLQAALASTPAQSLAAHDADVRAKALREAAALCASMDSCETDLGYTYCDERFSAAILALAERAPEVER